MTNPLTLGDVMVSALNDMRARLQEPTVNVDAVLDIAAHLRRVQSMARSQAKQALWDWAPKQQQDKLMRDALERPLRS